MPFSRGICHSLVCSALQPEPLEWKPMPFICSMAPIDEAHSKAIPDATVAKPLLIKEVFYGNGRIELLIDEQAHKRNRTSPFKRANLGDFSVLLSPSLLMILG
ncbi:hypothetical protein B9Z19DRAFT_1065685 [Tuber borchii]|uniref:Uncharacterized protein n=1 Tax=Tuber borchii TaxID=42251 RepID=A0A2T6ZQ51_TUBBO|nr:hypothetical protein B9Z19DRAFT_1065685 [Tuber borchii]